MANSVFNRLNAMHLWSAILVIYLTLCLLFGGASSQRFLGHGVLQAIAGIGLAVLIVSWSPTRKFGQSKYPVILMLLFASFGILQCVPLPIEWWRQLPVRDLLYDGFVELNARPSTQPISMNLDATISSLPYVLPPLFVLILCVRIGLERVRRILPVYVALMGVASVILGIIQIWVGDDSEFYLYQLTNKGLPVGLFANVNHQASFLLIALSFLAYLTHHLSRQSLEPDAKIAVAIVIATGACTIGFGIFSAGSVAGWIIFIPVSILCLFVSLKEAKTRSSIFVHLGIFAIFAMTFAIVATSPVLEGIGVTSFTTGDATRLSIWHLTIAAVQDHWMVGSGLGSFESVIALYEDPTSVTSIFIAKAHNEYLQILMELGAVGLVLIVLALAQFTLLFFRIWVGRCEDRFVGFRRSASIGVLAIAAHSLVDYPARTIAISVLLAACVAVITMPRVSEGREKRSIDPTEQPSKRIVL